MAKKHTRNQSTSLSPCFLSSKESRIQNKSHQKQEKSCCQPLNPGNTVLSHARVNQLSSNPFQFVKTRVEDSTNSLPRQFQTATATFDSSDPVCQYHYYQTNNNRWLNQNEYKNQNINCWLENVLKNNQYHGVEDEDFEQEQNTNSNDALANDASLDDNSASCLLRTKQRYKPYSACVKRDLPIIDQNETSYRQDKIKTLKALIARHDEHINGLKLCRNLETENPKQNNNEKKVQAERGKNWHMHKHLSKSKSNYKSMKDKKTSFDIRNPNSIFFAVMEEEQIARRRRGSRASPGHSWSCCATETLCEQQDEFLSHVELENISAS